MNYYDKYLKYKEKYINLTKLYKDIQSSNSNIFLQLRGGQNKYKVNDVVEIIGHDGYAQITEVLRDGLSYNLKEINQPKTIIRDIAEQQIKDFKIENPANKVIKGPKNPNIQQTNYPDLNLTDWNFITVYGNFKNVSTKFTIYEHKFNNDKSKPNLVVMSGFSENSVRESGYVILDKLPVLSKKYRAVYIINLSPFKAAQNNACDVRDIYTLSEDEKKEFVAKSAVDKKQFLQANEERIKAICREKSKTDPEHRAKKNANEIQMYKDASATINELISKLTLENVHLLGECAGGGLAIYTVNQHSRYTALFLAVPSSPLNIFDISDAVLQRVKFRFHWNINDEVQYDWHKEEIDNKNSFDEKNIYDNTMKHKIKSGLKIDYVSFMFSQDLKTTIENNRSPAHEIHRKFIDFIVNE